MLTVRVHFTEGEYHDVLQVVGPGAFDGQLPITLVSAALEGHIRDLLRPFEILTGDGFRTWPCSFFWVLPLQSPQVYTTYSDFHFPALYPGSRDHIDDKEDPPPAWCPHQANSHDQVFPYPRGSSGFYPCLFVLHWWSSLGCCSLVFKM